MCPPCSYGTASTSSAGGTTAAPARAACPATASSRITSSRFGPCGNGSAVEMRTTIGSGRRWTSTCQAARSTTASSHRRPSRRATASPASTALFEPGVIANRAYAHEARRRRAYRGCPESPQQEAGMRRLAPLAVLAGLLVLPTAHGAKPASGTVSATAATVQYSGPASAVPPALTRRACVEGTNCDTFDLVVNVPADFYNTNDRVLTVTISW